MLSILPALIFTNFFPVNRNNEILVTQSLALFRDIPCQTFEAGNLCKDRPGPGLSSFVIFQFYRSLLGINKMLGHEANIRWCLHGILTASCGLTRNFIIKGI